MIAQQSTQWYRSAVDQLTQVAAAIQRQEQFDLNSVSSLASDIVESHSRSDQLVVQALTIPSGSPGSQLITNLINVGILAAKVGAGLGYQERDLERLALAGLMHDIGLLAVPQSLVTKPGRLTLEERLLIEQHPELGSQAVRKLGTTHDWLAEIVWQAHERWNGQGYPNKLKGSELNEFAPIIGAVDVFDALVSPRPYRRRFLPHEAVHELVTIERTAFPRKVIKALVEQLSGYPIGTSVRLSTGERGTVIRVNPRYPLRPVVLIGVDPGEGPAGRIAAPEARQADLSASPLVTIIETVEPPDVAGLSYLMSIQGSLTVAIGTQAGREIEPATSVSGQFPALLQSLDAITNDIHALAESLAPGRHGIDSLPEGKSMLPRRRTAVQELMTTSFEKEVLGLFALEAQVWLTQIQRALKKFTEEEDQAVRPKLYSVMLQGITNLAKSAASVQLSAIEHMAMNLVPMLQDVGRQDLRAAADALDKFHEALARISTAIHRLTRNHLPARIEHASHDDDSAIEALVSSPLSNGQQAAAQQTVFQSSEGSEPPLLKALRALQQARARSVQPTRDVLEAVIRRAGHEAGEIGISVVERILRDLDRLDEQFVEDLNHRVTVTLQALHDLRNQEAIQAVTASQLDPIVREVEALYELANGVQDSIMTMVLDSLRSFLLELANRVQAPRLRSFIFVNAYKKPAKLRPSLEMVEARVQTLIPMAEQWVNIGRAERADIGRILRAYPDGRAFPPYNPTSSTSFAADV